MAQQTRQNKIFAAEDYTVVYESYVNANFQAFDYDTIRTAMVDYVRSTYPENYNDWIESAEFIALLDVVAQFGHNLAYRVDLNARNNFLTTAKIPRPTVSGLVSTEFEMMSGHKKLFQ